VLRATFPGIRDSVRELAGERMDALARRFVRTHNMKVKEEIERLAREYGKLKEPWVFVSK
jgi:predicted DNA-binding protein